MQWIAVHEQVLGGKLRGFRKKLRCSEAEALGILTLLWLWARNNTDSTGLLSNVDCDDIADILSKSISKNIDSEKVAAVLIECGWIDDINGQLYVHDWGEWQSYWYAHLEKKEKDKQRKRRERERAKQITKKSEEKCADNPEPKKTKPKKPKENKIMYADTVSMTQDQYNKLVNKYGLDFTEKLIYELDNYKDANNKTYANDYKAILNWVVEKCEKKYPDLLKKSDENASSKSENPFEEYM